jgi:hypothetical protein
MHKVFLSLGNLPATAGLKEGWRPPGLNVRARFRSIRWRILMTHPFCCQSQTRWLGVSEIPCWREASAINAIRRTLRLSPVPPDQMRHRRSHRVDLRAPVLPYSPGRNPHAPGAAGGELGGGSGAYHDLQDHGEAPSIPRRANANYQQGFRRVRFLRWFETLPR